MEISCTTNHDFALYQENDLEDYMATILANINKFSKLDQVDAPIRVRVLLVCSNAAQQTYLTNAKLQFAERHTQLPPLAFEYLTNEEITRRKWIPSNVSDWLLDSDIHLILSHFHQGISVPGNIDFNVLRYEQELRRLKNHVGFPNGLKMKCPIFLQDKWRYLSAISEICLPTLKFSLSADVENEGHLEILKSFFNKHAALIIKLPYTTNQIYKRKDSFDNVIQAIKELQKMWSDVIPYLMVQPWLKNRKEYKVVCVNEKALYETRVKTPQDAIRFGEKDERLRFAEKAIAILKIKCPEAIVDGLIRVDIMLSNDNKFVVNEFESLEANHEANTFDQRSFYCDVVQPLNEYYLSKLHSLTMEVVNDRSIKLMK